MKAVLGARVRTRQPMVHWPIVAAASVMMAGLVYGLVVALGSSGNRKDIVPSRLAWSEASTTMKKADSSIKNSTENGAKKIVGTSIASSMSTKQHPELLPAPVTATPVLPADVAANNKKPERAALVVKRRSRLNDEELRRMLHQVPEMSKSAIPTRTLNFVATAQKNRKFKPEELTTYDFAGLPMRMGVDCQLGKEPAEDLQALSVKLRAHIAQATQTAITTTLPRGTSAEPARPEALLEKLVGSEQRIWVRPEAIPTLTQMMMAENKPLRFILVDVLSKIKHPDSSIALARRAIYDLSEEVRDHAIQALAERPREEYREVLLDGLRYPWAPAADHAAEALATLRDTEAVPSLVALLDKSDPVGPFFSSRDDKQLVVREMVRINHLTNCTMCHAKAASLNDPVRGRVPVQGQPLAPPVEYYSSNDNRSIFVRADVTYLKQDFSVFQPVENHGPWPVNQRYDYMIRERPVNERKSDKKDEEYFVNRKTEEDTLNRLAQNQAKAQYEQREAVLFALRELTGKDLGASSKNWQVLLPDGVKSTP